MYRLIITAAALLAVASAQDTVQVKSGGLTCSARRRSPIGGKLNVQTYCYAGKPLVTNHSDLIATGKSVIAVHTFGADSVTWQFADPGDGTITYQVTADGATLKSGTLP